MPPIYSSYIPCTFLHFIHTQANSLSLLGFSHFSPPSIQFLMVPEIEKPRVTEIKVRMDCNGCVQKIKKALHGIKGIYDLYIDFPQQKLTIIGWAEPEQIVKAIRKTRKIATICSHTEQTEPPPPEQPQEQPPPPEGSTPPPETVNPPPAEAPQPETNPPPEPSKDPPPPEKPQPEATPSHAAAESNAGQLPAEAQPSGPKDVGEVHVVYHHPPAGYGHRYGYIHPAYAGNSYTGHWNRYPIGHEFPQEPPQPNIHVTHSYNAYKPSPYVTEYAYTHPPPRYIHYSRMDHYSDDYHSTSSGNGYSNGNGNITSMFSDENPNACTIV